MSDFRDVAVATDRGVPWVYSQGRFGPTRLFPQRACLECPSGDWIAVVGDDVPALFDADGNYQEAAPPHAGDSRALGWDAVSCGAPISRTVRSIVCGPTHRGRVLA